MHGGHHHVVTLLSMKSSKRIEVGGVPVADGRDSLGHTCDLLLMPGKFLHLPQSLSWIIFCLFFFFFRVTPEAHGSCQARGQTGAVAAGLHYSHGNARSESCLLPTPQLMATPDP